MKAEKLVHMANQIADFFVALPEPEAVAGTADHINKFWNPRMRRELLAYVAAGGAGLKPIALKAVGSVHLPREDAGGIAG